jgi:hypothetical protein
MYTEYYRSPIASNPIENLKRAFVLKNVFASLHVTGAMKFWYN